MEKKEPTLNGIPASQLRAPTREVWESRQRKMRIERLDSRLKSYQEIFSKRKRWLDSYRNYLDSEQWKATRIIKLLSVDFYCEQCDESLVDLACRKVHILYFKDHADMHHLHYQSIGIEKMDDLQALCRDCHYSIHAN